MFPSARLLKVIPVVAVIAPQAATGQAVDNTRTDGPRPVLPVAAEVALARSAAPPQISDEATVLALRGERFDTVVQGTNGVVCLVNRFWRDSLEPRCHDAESARTALRWTLSRTAGRVAGAGEEELDRREARATWLGEAPLPTRPAFSYMWSGGQRLWGDSTHSTGAWLPHTMIAVPYLTAREFGLPDVSDMRAGAVFHGGTAEATLVVPAPDFVAPGEEVEAALASAYPTVSARPFEGHSGGPSAWLAHTRLIDSGSRAYRALDPEREIALARSAAPPSVSDSAAVWVLQDGSYRETVPGTNGVHCMVARSLPLALEPICYDPEAARTAMRAELLRFELRRTGLPLDEVEAAIHQAVGAGEIRLPRRPALSYMMSAEQHLYASEEVEVGRWQPHIMLLVPGLTEADIGLSGPTRWLSVQAPGTPLAHAILVTPTAVAPADPAVEGSS